MNLVGRTSSHRARCGRAALALAAALALLSGLLPLGLAPSPALAAGSHTTVTLVPGALDSLGASLAGGAATAAEHQSGGGSWTVDHGASKFELYIDVAATPLGQFKVGDIQSISYFTLNDGTNPGGVDFSLYIYTEPTGTDDDDDWYGHRLTAEPYFAKNRSAQANTWNRWTTDDGENQLIFYDSNHGPNGTYDDPTLAEIQAGTVNWAVYGGRGDVTNIYYAPQEVKFISIQTGTAWTDAFHGFVDDLAVTLKDGRSVTFDLEESLPPPPPPPPPPSQPPVVLGSVSQVVPGDEGGTVTSSDGRFTLTVPSGLVTTTDDGGNTTAEDVTATVTPLAPEEQPEPGAGMVMVDGQVYEIVVEDAEGNSLHHFDTPLTLTFHFDGGTLPEGVSPEDLQVFYWDEALEAWVPVPSTVDPETGTVESQVDHLTVFMLAAGHAFIPNDVAGHWARGDILRLVAVAAVSGYEDGSFRPDALVTRAEFAKMLAGALRLTLPDADAAAAELADAFSDAASIPSWAVPYVAAAVDGGYLSGYADGTFRPGAPVKRDEVAVVAGRVLGGDAERATLSFTDLGAIPEWARDGVAAAVAAGILSGYEDGTFRPDREATRAEVATILVRLLEWKAGSAEQ